AGGDPAQRVRGDEHPGIIARRRARLAVAAGRVVDRVAGLVAGVLRGVLGALDRVLAGLLGVVGGVLAGVLGVLDALVDRVLRLVAGLAAGQATPERGGDHEAGRGATEQKRHAFGLPAGGTIER